MKEGGLGQGRGWNGRRKHGKYVVGKVQLEGRLFDWDFDIAV